MLPAGSIFLALGFLPAVELCCSARRPPRLAYAAVRRRHHDESLASLNVGKEAVSAVISLAR